MILNKLINKVKLIPSVVRGLLLRFRIKECGRRVLISKGLELHKRNALIHIGNNVRFYSNVKMSILGGGIMETLQPFL